MILVSDIDKQELSLLLGKFSLGIKWVQATAPIPGSFWGEPEAGLIGHEIFLRPDTPLQSALHEACHFVCMDDERRDHLDTTSGGDYDEENAVCYLQILLADHLNNSSQQSMMHDMDEWGYSFRLGSARTWFQEDAEDARQWLLNHDIITSSSQPTWKIRH
ncbi:MAG: hypothetical protein R3240_05485 [Gammaproteobacteria bacterium]|nr:hypothetical protein [Gammaproteobacteria bacterium]